MTQKELFQDEQLPPSSAPDEDQSEGAPTTTMVTVDTDHGTKSVEAPATYYHLDVPGYKKFRMRVLTPTGREQVERVQNPQPSSSLIGYFKELKRRADVEVCRNERCTGVCYSCGE